MILDDDTESWITDVPTQSLIGVLAQWGGALGFWMGLSAMTVFELIQLLISSVVHLRPKTGQQVRPAIA